MGVLRFIRISHKQHSQTHDPSRDVSNSLTETQVSNDYRRKITSNHSPWRISSIITKLGCMEFWRQNPEFWPRAPGWEGRFFSTERKAQHRGVSGAGKGLCREGNDNRDFSPLHPLRSKVQQPQVWPARMRRGSSCQRLLSEGYTGTPAQGAESWEGAARACRVPPGSMVTGSTRGWGAASCTWAWSIAPGKSPGKSPHAKRQHLSRQSSMCRPRGKLSSFPLYLVSLPTPRAPRKERGY